MRYEKYACILFGSLFLWSQKLRVALCSIGKKVRIEIKSLLDIAIKQVSCCRPIFLRTSHFSALDLKHIFVMFPLL